MTGTWDKIYVLDCEAFFAFKKCLLNWVWIEPFGENYKRHVLFGFEFILSRSELMENVGSVR